MSFHVLGPLEARVAGEEIVIGGAKQRAVLAVLLLRAGEVVSLERLVDEVWGDNPPPSASHTLESYVSRLRQLFAGHGPRLVRRGAGYALELGDATLDARGFADLQERASLATAMEDPAAVVQLTAAALALWRGPALGDVALASAGRAEADRLEELRLHTHELRFDAELALGRHEPAIGELQALVAQSPYRERFVAQLMLALYRAGRHAEALDVYEQTRRRLDDDLGLQPSADLQRLSGQIVRQDAQLRRPVAATREPLRPRRSSRMATLVAGGLAAAAVMTLTASGGTAPVESGRLDVDLNADRVALVLPRDPAGADGRDPSVHYSALGFRNRTTAWGQETETFVIGELTDAERRARDVVAGGFDLVIVAGDGPGARALVPLVRSTASTRFAFIGQRLVDLGLAGAPNAAGYPFADDESALLAGYLSGLVPPRRQSTVGGVPDVISVVVSPRTPQTERVVAGFTRGAKRASDQVRVLVDYVADARDRTACEAVANEQIDAGSDVVLAFGGPTCSSAALAVVRARGVWGIRAEDDRTQGGQHILGNLSRYWEAAVSRPIDNVELGLDFPAGKDSVLGLADDYSVLFLAEEGYVSDSLWSKVVTLCSTIRGRTKKDL
ncbi:MAG TPA: BTAD domain-containing putative transcriptional regulator [Gaiellaceae bacterium]|nr:BTAD domain-containing putative transcriptional regulator [Gaiellaceae bacterium]